MPHTNKKKKPDRNKRKEVVDENGWTRVTSGPNPAVPAPLRHMTLKPLDDVEFEPYTLRSDLEDVPSCTAFPITPQKAAEDMTIGKLLSQYKLIESRWNKSESCMVLKDKLMTRVLNKKGKIANCICFGTGTPSGLRDGWIQRHDVALYQIAAFKTVVDIIGRTSVSLPSTCF